ncbi:MAG: hypothetical protein M0Q92_06590 [Methanoregula sp.]|nr:hypothetical protein [Methanoregula sp.]
MQGPAKDFSHLPAKIRKNRWNNHVRSWRCRDLTTKRLDITGPVGAYCLVSVQKKAKALLPSDELIITCDTIPAATTSIPRIAKSEGMTIDTCRLSPGLWEITLKRTTSRNLAGPDL